MAKRPIAANQLGAKQYPGVKEAEFAGFPDNMVASPNDPPIIVQPEQDIPPAPTIHKVQPGDLITAQYINSIVDAVQNLQLRVSLLEAPDDSAQPGGDIA